MGGDYAPEATVLGAIAALPKIKKNSRIILFGDQIRIREILEREQTPVDNFEIVHTSEVIEMGDHPTQAFTKKTDSSITVGFRYLMEGRVDGFASAGSTGAMMVGCMYTVKQIDGVTRPAISTLIPCVDGGEMLLLDVGLNADCKPDVLYQYGIIGSTYAKSVLGKENPRVALLNIGEEKEKGNIQTKAAYELMEGSKDFNFVGNLEAKHLYDGTIADVAVCDGFVGNTILKQSEGIYEIAKQQGLEHTFFDKFNYEHVGGTPVLGINSTVLIGHGCSSPLAITNMILQTEMTVQAGVAGKLREIFKR